MMITMILSEMLAVAHIIIVALKFVTVRKYFECVTKNFLNDCKRESDIEPLAVKLKEDILKGILMHRSLLRFVYK